MDIAREFASTIGLRSQALTYKKTRDSGIARNCQTQFCRLCSAERLEEVKMEKKMEEEKEEEEEGGETVDTGE